MQPNLSSNLVQYNLDNSELITGSTLNYFQAAVIQNMRVDIIQQLVNTTPQELTESGKAEYFQQKAYLRGQLDILSHLLDASSSASSESSLPTFESEGN